MTRGEHIGEDDANCAVNYMPNGCVGKYQDLREYVENGSPIGIHPRSDYEKALGYLWTQLLA